MNFSKKFAFVLDQKCLLANVLPDPDFKYFSNANALYLSKKATDISNSIGSLFFVEKTYPLACLSNLASRLMVQPVYGLTFAHLS